MGRSRLWAERSFPISPFSHLSIFLSLTRLHTRCQTRPARGTTVRVEQGGRWIGVAKQLTGSPSEVRWFIKPEAFVVGLNHLTLSIKGTKITFHGPLVLRQQ